MKGRVVIVGLLMAIEAFAQNDGANRVLDDFKRELEQRSIAYFRDHYEPGSGLVRDRAANFEATPDRGPYLSASIAATGFALALFANLAERGAMPREEARAMIERTLGTAYHKLPHFHGWLYHFVDWHSGARYGRSEVSTVDTAWFMAGALYAAEVFPGGEVERLANALYERLEFEPMLTHGGASPDKLTLSMGWTPEEGYISWQWNSYAEQHVLLLLGLGHPSRPLPRAVWDAVEITWTTSRRGEKLIGGDLPLFIHQYSALFLGPGDFHDGRYDYFANSRLASEESRAATLSSDAYETYRLGYWGLSASDGPDGYLAFSPVHHNGTVCLGCAGASVMYDEKTVLGDLAVWAMNARRPDYWGRYGFSDGINIDRGWYGRDVTGITVGALALALGNVSSEPLWRKLPKALRRGLEVARDRP